MSSKGKTKLLISLTVIAGLLVVVYSGRTRGRIFCPLEELWKRTKGAFRCPLCEFT